MGQISSYCLAPDIGFRKSYSASARWALWLSIYFRGRIASRRDTIREPARGAGDFDGTAEHGDRGDSLLSSRCDGTAQMAPRRVRRDRCDIFWVPLSRYRKAGSHGGTAGKIGADNSGKSTGPGNN